MNHRGTESRRLNEITEAVIGAAIEVHRTLGPGLLESAYEECLCAELKSRRLRFVRQVDLPVQYKGLKLDCGYRMDLVVEDMVVVEIKAIQALLPVHSAQLLTYLRLAQKPVGLLVNFFVPMLKDGIKRIRNGFSVSPCLCGENECCSDS